ncbi:antitoxin Xre/MbcA/ParS toxin-binding domain-containing protein [Chitinimonas naiadis]
MVDEPGFDAAKWLDDWVRQPVPALGGVRPIELLDTAEGFELVVSTLAAIENGAYR